MALRPVLILTAGFGEGHNAAARNLRDALRQAHPDLSVEVLDIFHLAYGWVNGLSQRGYLFVINHLPCVWSLVFRWLHGSPVVSERMGVLRKAAALLRAAIDELQPGVIVSTYPGYNHLLDHIFDRVQQRSYRQITVVTDSITINAVWHAGHSDFYLVANEPTAEVMRRDGVPVDKLRVTGFPVPPTFEALLREKNPPAPGEKWRVLFMVNSGKRTAVQALRELVRIEGIDLAVTVGRDDRLMRRLRAIIRSSGKPVELYGWTDQLPRLIAESHIVISKAGGATVQECLALASPMIVSQVVPGQEEGNARLIVDTGSGRIAETPEAMVRELRCAMADDGAVWQGWHRMARLQSRPGASREMADWILTLCQ